jgi:hypothetical protein
MLYNANKLLKFSFFLFERNAKKKQRLREANEREIEKETRLPLMLCKRERESEIKKESPFIGVTNGNKNPTLSLNTLSYFSFLSHSFSPFIIAPS